MHAGVDEEAEELWPHATPQHALTEKYPPTVGRFVKTAVAGHVPTSELYTDGSHGVYFDGASHYYLGAKVKTTSTLNVLRCRMSEGEYEWFVVSPAVG